MIYLDTSAAVKLLVDEAESDAMHHAFMAGDALVSSMSLYIELKCAAARRPQLDAALADAICQSIVLVDLIKPDFIRAANSPWRLRGADALHLAVALRIGASSVMTYDAELATAARSLGLAALSPGIDPAPATRIGP